MAACRKRASRELFSDLAKGARQNRSPRSHRLTSAITSSALRSASQRCVSTTLAPRVGLGGIGSI